MFLLMAALCHYWLLGFLQTFNRGDASAVGFSFGILYYYPDVLFSFGNLDCLQGG